MASVSTPQQEPPLKAAIDRRLDELRLNLTDVGKAADISLETLRTWRTGTRRPHRKTALRLDDALAWEPGSTLAAYDGGEPTPRFIAENEAEQRIATMRHVTPAQKLKIIERMRANQAAAIEEAQALDELARHRDRREGRNTA